MGIQSFRQRWQNVSLTKKVGVGIILLFVFVFSTSGLLYLVQQNLDRNLNLQREKINQTISELQDIRAGHIRWKVNLLTAILNENYTEIIPDTTFQKLTRFRTFNSYTVDSKVWMVLEEDSKRMNELIEKMRTSKTPEELFSYYNQFQEPSKRFLWEGLEKIVEEYKKFEGLERQKLLKTKQIFQIIYGVFVLITLIVVVFGAYFIGKRLREEFGKALSASRTIAQGNFRMELDISRRDEVGVIFKALDEIKSSFNEVILSTQEICNEMEPLVKSFKSLGESAKVKSQEMEMKMNRVLENMQRVLENLEGQKITLGQIRIAIEEISKNVGQTSSSAQLAMERALKTQELINTLQVASREIEGIVQFIRDIAEQTNLLALNASIEAARAGEAGKGFAVVANEVKELARQTDQAGVDITQKIKDIQDLHQAIIHAVNTMVEVFGEVKDLSSIVASAVEEQSIALADIEQHAEESKNLAVYTADSLEDIERSFKEIEEDIAKNVSFALTLEEFSQRLLFTISHFLTYQVDRRKFSRIKYFEEVSFIHQGKRHQATLKDLSYGGFYLYSDYKPLPEERIELFFKTEASEIKTEAQVIRIDSEGFAGEILKISEEDLEKLRKLFRKYYPEDRVEKELERFLSGSMPPK
jgi:methyl-accepting chemotaxis protein